MKVIPRYRRMIQGMIFLIIYISLLLVADLIWEHLKRTVHNSYRQDLLINSPAAVVKILPFVRQQRFKSSVTKFRSPIKNIKDSSDKLLFKNEEQYVETQHGISNLVEECTRNEETFLSWDLSIVRNEVELRTMEPLIILGIAAGYVPLDRESDNIIDVDNLETQFREYAKLKHGADVKQDFHRETLVDFLMQYGMDISPKFKERNFKCYPVIVDVPIHTRGRGMCIDASFYAFAFQGAISSGIETRLWDILCPDTVRITLESYGTHSVSWSKPSWAMLNFEQTWFPYAEKQVWFSDVFLSKGKHVHETISTFLQDRGRYSISLNLGMSSMDFSVLSTTKHVQKDWNRFALIKGKSGFKNADMIVNEIWKKNPNLPILDVISSSAYENLPNVNGLYGNIDASTVAETAVRDGIHLCLSIREGFGHYINEARAVGALIIGTNHPPMNELVTAENGVLVDPRSLWRSSEKTFSEYDSFNAWIDSKYVLRAIQKVISMPKEDREKLGNVSRRFFLQDFHNFFNKSHTLAKPYLLSQKVHELPRRFPTFDSSARNDISASHIGNPLFWFRSDYTSLREIIDDKVADKWTLMWPDSKHQSLTSHEKVERFYQAHRISGRIIRDWGSPNGEIGIRFDGAGCMKVQTIGTPVFAPDTSHNNIDNVIAIAVRFLTTEFSDQPQVVYHDGGILHGLDVYIQDRKVKVQMRDESWLMDCDFGYVSESQIVGVFVQVDVYKRKIMAYLNGKSMAGSCNVDGWGGWGVGRNPIWHTRRTAGGRSVGCIIGAMPMLINQREWVQLRDGSASFKGFIFDVIYWERRDKPLTRFNVEDVFKAFSL